MSDLVERLFTRRLRGAASSSPLLADANEDGWPEIFVGGPALSGLHWDGDPLPRWPKKGGRPFASSPAFADINGDGRGELVCGCDDGRVYAFYPDGASVAGWPVKTGADVFSTPALADLDGDRASEVIIGSDDGMLRILKGDGRPLWTAAIPGRPFVSASATVADLDADKSLEIAIGAWDRRMHVWSAEGAPKTTAMPEAGHVVWSSGTAFEIKGRDRFIAWGSDAVYVASGRGTILPGWPARAESWMVSSPAVADLGGGRGPVIVVGAERVYAWDLSGRLLPGWPVDCGDFSWSSPLLLDVDGDGTREIVIGSWDGGIRGIRPDGSSLPGFPLATSGPIFATPAASPLPDGGGLLIAASWDGTIRGWRLPRARFAPGDWLQFRGSAARTGAQGIPLEAAREPPASTEGRLANPLVRGARVERWAWGRGLERIAVEGRSV